MKKEYLKPCDCKDAVDASSLNEQGIGINDYCISVEPNVVVLKIESTTVKIPMSIFKKFSEWFLEEQELDKNLENVKDDITPNQELLLACHHLLFDDIMSAIKKGADINVIGDDDLTPLMIVSKLGRELIVRYLIENGADVNKRNSKNYTALMYASKFRRFDVVKYLVNVGADTSIKNNNGLTAYQIAIENDHKPVIDFFKINKIFYNFVS